MILGIPGVCACRMWMRMLCVWHMSASVGKDRSDTTELEIQQLPLPQQDVVFGDFVDPHPVITEEQAAWERTRLAEFLEEDPNKILYIGTLLALRTGA